MEITFRQKFSKVLKQFFLNSFPLVDNSKVEWGDKVLDKLTFVQIKSVKEKRITSVDQLDLAAILRLIDQNWYELKSMHNLPAEVLKLDTRSTSNSYKLGTFE